MREAIVCFLFVVMLSTFHADATKPKNYVGKFFEYTKLKRGFGDRTVCIPKRVKVCRNFTYHKMTKRYCVYFTESNCTSLDKK